MSKPTKAEAIEIGAAAIERATEQIPEKTQRALAQRLGVSEQRLTMWKRRGVPIAECPEVVENSQGLFTPYDLRADFFGRPASDPREGDKTVAA